MQKRVFRMNLRDANHAAMQERTAEKRRESTLQPYALIAEKRLRFPLNPQTTDLFTAASVTRQESSN